MVLQIILTNILLIARIFPHRCGARTKYHATRKISARIICKTIEGGVFIAFLNRDVNVYLVLLFILSFFFLIFICNLCVAK